MAKEELEIVIGAKDQASKKIGGIAGSLKSLGAAAKGTALKGIGGAANAASLAISGLGTAVMGTIAVAATAAAGAAVAVGAGLKYAISEAMEAQEVQAQLANVLRSTGGAAGVTADMVNELADALTKETRYSDEAIISADNILLTFTNIGKDIFPEVTEAVLDMSTAFGQDLKSSAIQIGKAMQDPITGAAALRRVGVQLTDAQEDLIKKLVESGDVMGAQRIIMDELKREFGGSAKAAGQTFAGQLDILKNSLSNVAEEVGTVLMPYLEGAFKRLIPAFQDIAQTIGDFFKSKTFQEWFGKAINWISGFIEKIAWFLRGEAFAVSGEESIFGKVANFINGKFIPTIQEAVGWIGREFKQIWPKVSQLITTVFLPAIRGIWHWMATRLPQAVMTVVTFVNRNLIPALISIAQWIMTNVVPRLQELWDWLSQKIANAIPIIGGWIQNTLIPALIQIGDFIMTKVVPALQEVWNWLQTNVPAAIQTVSDWVNGTLIPALTDLYGWFQEKILPAIQSFGEFFVNLATGGEDPFGDLGNSLYYLAGAFGLSQETSSGLLQTIRELQGAVEDIKSIFGLFEIKIGDTNSKVNLLTIGLNLLKAGWEFQLWIIKLVATEIHIITSDFNTLLTAIKDVASGLSTIQLPDWLTPGSPTPLELGLKGINKQMSQLSHLAPSIIPTGSATSMPAYGGGGVTVVYSPQVSFATQAELETRLVPMIDSAMRRVRRGKV